MLGVHWSVESYGNMLLVKAKKALYAIYTRYDQERTELYEIWCY